MKRIISVFLIFVLTLGLVACGGGKSETPETNGGEASSETTVLRVGHVLSSDHSYQMGLEHFAKLVNEKTDGSVKVEIFSDSQLGNERDLVEGMQLGTVEMGLISTGPISGFVPEIMLLDLPYIFESADHAVATLDGEVGDLIDEKIKDVGVINLAWWEQGFRSVYNNVRPIETPEDMKNVSLRVMENPLMMDTFEIMGGNSTPMAWGEVYTGIQQGVIDGAEGAAETAYTGGFGEVCKYGSLTKQFYSAVPLLISEIAYNKLSEEEKIAINEAAIEARDYERELIRERESEFIKKMEESGIVYNEPDLAPFKEVVQPLYEKYANEIGGMDLIQKVLDQRN